MLAALYDLSKSPLTFDFAYAAVQSEIERRRRGHEKLVFHILRGKDHSASSAYSRGEAEWRLRHIIIPLSQMLPVAADVRVSHDRPFGAEIFSRAYGLHWLSDVAIMAQRGEDVQVLRARDDVKSALSTELETFSRGRRIISITLRETHYAPTRNSDVRSWAALARMLPRDKYAVVVLRDHERVSDPLTEDWGEVIALPKAVWFLHQRIALYELAWLNLAVNNGPLGILALDRKTRFQIFKLDGGTWETSPQHFRRLGIAPGKNFPFLRPHQQMIWCDDHIFNLRRHIFTELEALEAGTDPDLAPSGDAIDCLMEAAQRDYRSGAPAADTIARIPAGARRSALAFEWGRMLLDEGRPLEAAQALREAPRSAQAAAEALTIVHVCSDDAVIEVLAPLLKDAASTKQLPAARNAGMLRTLDVEADEVGPPSAPLVVRIPGGSSIGAAVTLLGIAERERRRRGIGAIELFLEASDEQLLAVSSLFPSIVSFALVCRPSGEWSPSPEATDSWARGMASVPLRSGQLLARWLRINALGRGYVLVASAAEDMAELRDRASKLGEELELPVVDYAELSTTWPLEMLAGLLARATVRVLGDPAVRKIASALGLDDASTPSGAKALASDPEQRRLDAENAFWRGKNEPSPEAAVALLSRAVNLAPDVTPYRSSFATALARFDPTPLARPPAFRLLRRKGILAALTAVILRSGRPAASAESFAVGLLLALPRLREGLERAATARPDDLDRALSARPLRAGAGARALGALLGGVAIREPSLLILLEAIRKNLVLKILAEPDYRPSAAAAAFSNSMARQVWIQDGVLVSRPDPLLAERLSLADDQVASIALARRLMP